jgi:hypothetical protein
VIGGFLPGWLDLPIRVVAGAGGVLMGPVDRGVHRHLLSFTRVVPVVGRIPI